MKKTTLHIFLILAGALTGCTEKNELSKYPAVHEESHHQIDYLNDDIRILKVNCEVGDSCAFHCHTENIAYVAISGTELRLDSLDGASRKVELPSGWMSMDTTYPSTPMCHRFTNVGSEALLIYAIEFIESMRSRSYSWQWNSIEVSEEAKYSIPSNSLLFYNADSLLISNYRESASGQNWTLIQKQDTVIAQTLGKYAQQLYVLNWL